MDHRLGLPGRLHVSPDLNQTAPCHSDTRNEGCRVVFPSLPTLVSNRVDEGSISGPASQAVAAAQVAQSSFLPSRLVKPASTGSAQFTRLWRSVTAQIPGCSVINWPPKGPRFRPRLESSRSVASRHTREARRVTGRKVLRPAARSCWAVLLGPILPTSWLSCQAPV